MSSQPFCSSNLCQSNSFFPRTTFAIDSGKLSCNFFSWPSSCLARILTFNRFFFLSIDTSFGGLKDTYSIASFVIFSNAFSSMGWLAFLASSTNCVGAYQVPTKTSPSDLSCDSPSWYSPLRDEGITFCWSVRLMVGGSHRMSANSGTSWDRFLCWRCWTAKVFSLCVCRLTGCVEGPCAIVGLNLIW